MYVKGNKNKIISNRNPANYPTMDDKEIISPLKSSDRMKQEKNVI